MEESEIDKGSNTQKFELGDRLLNNMPSIYKDLLSSQDLNATQQIILISLPKFLFISLRQYNNIPYYKYLPLYHS